MASKDGTKRPTLRDIAQRAGVSQAAASFAINDKPGVSDETRQRVRFLANEMGWVPSFAARALADARSNTIGMVISRSARSYGSESFFLRLVTGIQQVLSTQHQALLFQVIESVDEEIETYRRWCAERRVDGVILVDLRVEDPRPSVLRELGLPCVLAGGPEPHQELASVYVDDGAAMGVAMQHLRERGFPSVAYLSGPTDLWHITERIAAFEREVTHGFEFGLHVPTDFSSSAGASATEAVLKVPTAPHALIFDNEVLALSGLAVAGRLGLRVPEDVGVLSWEDTELCSAVHPTLTALRRDALKFGADVARRLLTVIDGTCVGDQSENPPTLIARESTRR